MRQISSIQDTRMIEINFILYKIIRYISYKINRRFICETYLTGRKKNFLSFPSNYHEQKISVLPDKNLKDLDWSMKNVWDRLDDP